jgi:hypothetical protein
MFNNSRRKDLIRVTDHLQCIGVTPPVEKAFQDIRDLGSDTQNDGAMRRNCGTDGRPNCRVSHEALPRALKIRHAVKQNVLAVHWQPTLGRLVHPNGSGHNSDPVEHFQVTRPKGL